MNYANYDDALSQLRSAGLEIEEPIAIGGTRSQRCRETGGDREKRGWYWLHELPLDDGLYLVGSYGIYRGDDAGTQKIILSKKCHDCGHIMGMKESTCPKCNSKNVKRRELTQEQKDAVNKRQTENKRRIEAERKTEADRAAQWAHQVWTHSREAAPREHDYLDRKQLNATGGVRIFESNEGLLLKDADKDDVSYLATFHGALVIPMCDITTGAVRGLQFILGRGHHQERIAKTGRDKEYWPSGMQKDGIAHLVGGTMAGVGLVCEGYATGISLHEATGIPVAIAFDANSLIKVGSALRKQYRNRVELIYCADDDWLQRCKECKQYTPVAEPACRYCGKPHGKINAGVQRASEAALATSGKYIVPQFSTARPDDKKGPTDFNDLHCLEGLNAVRAQLEAILPQRTGQHAPQARGAQHGGEGERLQARISIDDAAVRYVGTYGYGGKVLFDTQERRLVTKDDVLNLLPRHGWEQLKEHPAWRVVRDSEIGFDPTEQDRNILCNLWGGWPTTPKKGRCQWLLDLLAYLCSGEENGLELYEWIIKWLAYPIQHPGAKMKSAVVVHGPQGTGKSRFFEAYAKIFGQYGRVLDQSAIEDNFNADWASKKLFILADEVLARGDMFHLKNRLKGFITGDTIRVNTKMVTAHTERNCMNIVFLSNEKQPLVLENDDRRHCVIWTPPKLPDDIYDQVNEEIDNGGIEALHDYLLHLDLGNFKPWTWPPTTKAKRELIDLGIGSEERFMHEWTTGQTEYPFGPCLSMDLYAAYQRWSRANGVSRPRESNQFNALINKMPGWKIDTPKVYETHHHTGPLKTKRIVVPSDQALEAAKQHDIDATQKPGQNKTQWLTDSYIAFKAALEGQQT